MSKPVVLNERIKRLVKKLATHYRELEPWINKDKVSLEEVLKFLKDDFEFKKKHQFAMEVLRAKLLNACLNSLLSEKELLREKKKQASLLRRMLFAFLIIAGTILAICEGFDGVVSILSTMSFIPAFWVFTAGVLFSSLSVIVFYGFDFVAISNNLHINFLSSPQLIDVLLYQIQVINALRKKIDQLSVSNDEQELKLLLNVVQMLSIRFHGLQSSREHYQKALQNPILKTAKLLIALVAGFLFFAAGFFSGQSLAMGIAGLSSSTATVLSLPILCTSIGVGIAAFSIYWFVERPGVENLLGRWFGLDKDKIDQFTDEDVIEKHAQRLHQVEMKIHAKLAICRKLRELKGERVNSRSTLVHKDPEYFQSWKQRLVGEKKSSANDSFHGVTFFPRARSADDLLDVHMQRWNSPQC